MPSGKQRFLSKQWSPQALGITKMKCHSRPSSSSRDGIMGVEICPSLMRSLRSLSLIILTTISATRESFITGYFRDQLETPPVQLLRLTFRLGITWTPTVINMKLVGSQIPVNKSQHRMPLAWHRCARRYVQRMNYV